MLVPGYQCTVKKSISGATTGMTVWFQPAESPAATTPSGQLPGMVSTAPTLIVGSTAFIARTNSSVVRAYAAGLLSGWSSVSQVAP